MPLTLRCGITPTLMFSCLRISNTLPGSICGQAWGDQQSVSAVVHYASAGLIAHADDSSWGSGRIAKFSKHSERTLQDLGSIDRQHPSAPDAVALHLWLISGFESPISGMPSGASALTSRMTRSRIYQFVTYQPGMAMPSLWSCSCANHTPYS